MNLSVEDLGGSRALIRLEGRLDLVHAGDFREAVRDAVAGGRTLLVVDMAAVPLIDSTGIGALVGGLRQAREAGGELRMAGAGDQVRTVLSLTKVDRVLKAYATVDEALDGL